MSKRVTLLVYGGDRNLWAGPPLTCRVIELFANGGPRVLDEIQPIRPPVELQLDLLFDAGQAYGISLEADDHRSGWRVLNHQSFLRDSPGGPHEVERITVRPMLVHTKAISTDADAGFEQLVRLGSPFALYGADRFAALASPLAKFAFFNLEAKLRETWVDGRRLLSFVRGVNEVAVDRVFLSMAAEARGMIERAADFRTARGHGKPRAFPALPAHPVSWKHSAFPYGNLQLSFSESILPLDNGGEQCYSVDVDIDLERDLGHAFEFVFNQVFNRKTDQTLVYRLLWDQNILPAFSLSPPAPLTAGVAPIAVAMRGRPASRRGRTPGRTGARRRPARRPRKRAGRRSS